MSMWLQLTDRLSTTLAAEEERRKAANDRAWELNAHLIRLEMFHSDPLVAAAAAGAASETSADEASAGQTRQEEELDRLVRDTVLDSNMYNDIVHRGGLAVGIDGEGRGEETGEGEGGRAAPHPRAPRLSNLSYKMEDYAQFKAFCHFLQHGTLIPPDAPCFLVSHANQPTAASATTTEQDQAKSGVPTTRSILTDEEYLSGCISLCHQLSRHAVTRASNALSDPLAVTSVRVARDVVSGLLEEMLQFDFRNGPLRRRYDGLKYALKNLETVLYELSVAGVLGGRGGGGLGSNDDGDGDGDGDGDETKEKKDDDDEEGDVAGHLKKKMKIEKEDDVAMYDEEEGKDGGAAAQSTQREIIIPKEGFAAIKERMDHRDALRERLIKTCRDGQKAAKQAIFALHRGDSAHALKLLNQCEKCVANDLMPILHEEPNLRGGSFSGVMEEYVEGMLFYTWLQPTRNGDGNNDNGGSELPSGRILMHDELKLPVSPEEYLGGLCDLSGEIGRYAVARGTKRDRDAVKVCLDTNRSMYMALKMIGRLPGNCNKKVNALSKSVEKLERVMYELSLMEMTGRREFASSMEDETAAAEGNEKGED